jgi:hypothetical protein
MAADAAAWVWPTTTGTPAGSSVVFGVAVALKLSDGARPVGVPVVVGQTQAAASAAITGVGLVVGAITQAHSATVPVGCVISQDPAGDTVAEWGTAVDLVLSLGPESVGEGEGEGVVEGESEGEGEVESLPVMAQTLYENFSVTDTDHSGGLSLGEVQAQHPALDAGNFNTLDANHNGQLTQDELDQYLNPDQGGCKKSSFTLRGLQRRFGELFMLGLGLTVLALKRKVM